MSSVEIDSPSVQTYLTILQGVINRMAANSAACKTWAVGLVSAILVVASGKNEASLASVSLIPIVLFFFLDAYYLGLERLFRTNYNAFVTKLHAGEAAPADVFVVTPRVTKKDVFRNTLSATTSIAVWPFYLLLAVMLVVVGWVATAAT